MSVSEKCIVFGAVVAFLVLPREGLAQSPDESAKEGGGALQEVVVTAQKRAENLQTVPIAITALSASQLSGANVVTMSTLQSVTPNLNITQLSSFSTPYIRGIGTQFVNPGLESSVAVYFDDTYLVSASGGYFNFNDIARVEVLNGPQGTLYGRNATGGAIRVITKDPTDEFEASASATAGSYSQVGAGFVVSGKLFDGVDGRLAYQHDQNAGYVRNLTPGPGDSWLQDRNENFVRGKLLITPGDRLTIKLSGEYIKRSGSEGDTFVNLNPGLPGQIAALPALGGGKFGTRFYETATNVPELSVLKSWGGAGRVDYDMSFARLSSITTTHTDVSLSVGDVDGTSANFEQGTATATFRTFSQELQLVSSIEGPFSYVAGLYYLNGTGQDDFNIFGNAVAPAPAIGTTGKVHTTSIAPYAQVDYRITSQLKLTLGERYTHETKTVVFNEGVIGTLGSNDILNEQLVLNPGGICSRATPVQLCSTPPFATKFNRSTPKVTLSYTPTDSTLVYATYSEGFKSGGVSLPAFLTVASVAPEVLKDYELGFKGEFGSVRINGAAFYYNYKDIQLSQFIDGLTTTTNAATAKVKGFEASVLWQATPALQLGGGFGFLDPKYTDYKNGIATVPAPTPRIGYVQMNNQDFSGHQMIDAAKWSAYGRGAYEIPISSALGSLVASVTANYQSKFYYDAANLFSEPGRTLVNARLAWSSPDDRFTVSVFGNNITNRHYDVATVPDVTGGFRIPGPPAWYGGTVSVKF